MTVEFECTCFSTFRDLPKRSSCHGEVGDGSGGMNGIYSRPEVADDASAGTNDDIFRCYSLVNLWFAGCSSFREKSKSPIYVMRRRRLVLLNPIFGVKKQKMSNASDSKI